MEKSTNEFEVESIDLGGMQTGMIIVDKETGVQYLLATSLNTVGVGAGMTVLVDETGKPKLKKV